MESLNTNLAGVFVKLYFAFIKLQASPESCPSQIVWKKSKYQVRSGLGTKFTKENLGTLYMSEQLQT